MVRSEKKWKENKRKELDNKRETHKRVEGYWASPTISYFQSKCKI
jgi:hypothetical protein